MTRLSISSAIGVVSQFMHAPTTKHLKAAYCIVQYLKKSPAQGYYMSSKMISKLKPLLMHIGQGQNLIGALLLSTIALWEVTLLHGKNKKQPVVARSCEKAEYRVMTHAICVIQWICGLLRELVFMSQGPMNL